MGELVFGGRVYKPIVVDTEAEIQGHPSSHMLYRSFSGDAGPRESVVLEHVRCETCGIMWFTRVFNG